MSWLMRITSPGPASPYARISFSDHVYVYEEETMSGHCLYYLGSPHLDMLDTHDYVRAIYRAKSITTIWSSIQRLTNSTLWQYDNSTLFFNDASFSLSLKDENIALEELVDPFKNHNFERVLRSNQYHNYLHLAATDDLVHNVLLLLNDAYSYTQFFYINLYKIVETIQNDWRATNIASYSTDAKAAYDFLNGSNVRGYMNNFIASGLYSRHGFTNRNAAAPSILNPPPVENIKEELLCLINGWLNYKIDPNRISYKLR
ncbi:hypothetical protein ABE288_20985 [Bacillus salipaludis]|uniref:hypothetical protein n=1 Tax=Bacillus salipaludis TaxID=2547811 RepID=UPI003D1C0733